MNFKDINAYINSLYEKNQSEKKKFLAETELKEFGTVIDEDVARMLQILIRLTKTRSILEIGTSIGYSTISMAQVIREFGGKITTIELDAQTANQAIQNFERAGVTPYVEVKIGDASSLITEIQEKFDLIFQDVGDKRLYSGLLKQCVQHLKPGGLLLAEDSLFPAMNRNAQWCEPINEFNKMVAESPDLESTILPVGDGLTVAIKIS